MNGKYAIGIDVGTGSARAGIFDFRGRRAGVGVQPITILNPQPEFAEYSSAEIWESVCKAVRAAMTEGNVKPEDVGGIAFDATCSMVAVDGGGKPVSVSPTGDDAHNVIAWFDHRAIADAEKLTRDGHDVLRYLGGVVSPEHQIPKLVWLRKNMPKQFARTAKYFDLADWLTFVCTGRDVRSLCTTVCKWTYLGHEKTGKQWNAEFFKQNGIIELLQKDKIGSDVQPMGKYVGALQAGPARELGLAEGTPVAVGIIDAHAGGIGVLGMGGGGASAKAREAIQKKAATRSRQAVGEFDDVLCLIGGTSSCHMAVSPRARFVRGVWGPYYSAMIPDYWLNEGGQSATGALLDFIINTHPQAAEAKAAAQQEGRSVYEFLNARVPQLAKAEKRKLRCEITDRLHMLGYFRGNRSPNADPLALGAIHGLPLHATLDDLVRLYYATIQAIAYGTRDIIDALNAKGYAITRIHACGGGTKNPLWIQEHADITGCTIHLPKEPEAVLLGSAILAAVGAGRFANIPQAMAAMSHAGGTVKTDPRTADYHARKLRIFRELYKDQRKYNSIAGK